MVNLFSLRLRIVDYYSYMQATIKDPKLKILNKPFWQLKVKPFSFYALRPNCLPVLWLTVNPIETLFYRVSPDMRTSSQFEFHLLQLLHNNEPFPRCLLPLRENESSGETIHPFMWKWVPHTSSCQSNSFQIKDFASLVMKQRQWIMENGLFDYTYSGDTPAFWWKVVPARRNCVYGEGRGDEITTSLGGGEGEQP